MSDSVPPSKPSAASMANVPASNVLPMPSPNYPAKKVEGPANTSENNQPPAAWESQQAQAGVRTEKSWNTKSLIPRLATDAVSAASAAVLVAPLITIIDK